MPLQDCGADLKSKTRAKYTQDTDDRSDNKDVTLTFTFTFTFTLQQCAADSITTCDISNSNHRSEFAVHYQR